MPPPRCSWPSATCRPPRRRTTCCRPAPWSAWMASWAGRTPQVGAGTILGPACLPACAMCMCLMLPRATPAWQHEWCGARLTADSTTHRRHPRAPPHAACRLHAAGCLRRPQPGAAQQQRGAAGGVAAARAGQGRHAGGQAEGEGVCDGAAVQASRGSTRGSFVAAWCLKIDF